MNSLDTIVMLVTFLVGAYIVFASSFALTTMLRGKDREYQKKYEEFLRQKGRVEERLKKARESQQG